MYRTVDKVAEGNLARKMPEDTDMGEGKACPCLLLCCCAKALTKSNLGKNGFIWLTAHTQFNKGN